MTRPATTANRGGPLTNPHSRCFMASANSIRRRERLAYSPGDHCLVPDCGGKIVAKHLCAMHYARKRRRGDPTFIVIAPAGTGTTRSDGYRAHKINGKETLEHRAIAERALGRPLPSGVEVHHANANRGDNGGGNLVICPDRAYHQLIHQRMRALDACGHADWLKCTYCKRYDTPGNIVSYTSKKGCTSTHHAQCKRDHANRAYWAKKEKK